MKKIYVWVLFLCLALSGRTQFVAMPLNFPFDTSAYLSRWTSIIDESTIWVGTARQRNHGYIAYSQAIKTTDGGNTWQFFPIPVLGNPWIQHLAAWDANICYYLFTDGTTYGGAVWKTSDGGTTWSKKTTTQFTGGWANIIHAFSADTVLTMGDPTGGYFEIQLTFDGGNSWTRVPSSDMPAALTGETGTSSEYCAVGNSIWFPTSKGRCFASSDRGMHWTVSQVVSAYISISFADEMNGIAYEPGTSNGLYHSSDGGLTWIHNPLGSSFIYGSMSRVPGINGGYVVTSNDTTLMSVYFTPDSFNTIVQIDSNIHNASIINFKNPTTGWLGGSYNPNHNIHKFTGILTAVAENSKNIENILIIPNPSSIEALVKIPKKCISGITRLKIIDMAGKTVYVGNVDTSTGWMKLNASSYPGGIYLIELTSGTGAVISQRWVVQH